MFYLSEPSVKFCGKSVEVNRALSIIVGIPLDSTVSRIHGTKFAPESIRKESMHLESYSLRYGVDFEKLSVCDIGDITVYDLDPIKSLNIIEETMMEILDGHKTVVAIGGEHLITLPIVKVLTKQHGSIGLLVFDAHLDLRDEYPPGYKFTHATVIRRIVELRGVDEILIVGVRGVSTEELEFVKIEKKLSYIPIYSPTKEVMHEVRQFMGRVKKVYISIDMDVLDPSIAPGVGNPEPGGYNFREFMYILHTILSSSIVGFDVVETYPPYDINNITSSTAARIIYELISGIHSRIK
ncbi:MAG: agmatinase [Thermoprotei archaeon]|nr:MAG: agmatinase [Thermoprotei archaeon]